MIFRNKYAKDLTEYGWIVTCITWSQAKGRKMGILKMRLPFILYNWNSHCLCDQNSNAASNLIADEETREKQKKEK